MRKHNKITPSIKGALYICLGSGLLLASGNANAVPSYARQTGLACSACHTIYPKLTPFGRMFKLNGYTTTGMKQIQAKESSSVAPLKIDSGAPLSAMVQVAWTHTKSVAADTRNNVLSFPSSLSLYYAGEISPHIGSFLQVTMDDADSSFGFDMADIRYANTTTTSGDTAVTYGVSVDNMSGMEDLWNTTPSWTFPYLAASPDHGSDDLAFNTLMGVGLGAYAMFDNHWYAYLGDYSPKGTLTSTVINASQKHGNFTNVTPYWRFAWQGTVGQRGYLEVGTYGTVQKWHRTNPGTSDKYTDTAIDAQYELPVSGGNEFNAHAVYMHESQTLDATLPADSSQHMNQTRADVAYIVHGQYQYQLGYFNTTESSGAHTAMMDMHNGDDKGYVAEFDYIPWENTKFAIQYTGFSKYDGSTGSAASDNDAWLINAWFMW